jgi:quinol monooxygenase YgiN
MVLVMMEAQVPAELEETLLRAYAHAMKHRPDSVLQSMLTRDTHDPACWRILTVWESHEAMAAYYRSGNTMPSAYAFHLTGIEPVATSSEVIAYE